MWQQKRQVLFNAEKLWYYKYLVARFKSPKTCNTYSLRDTTTDINIFADYFGLEVFWGRGLNTTCSNLAKILLQGICIQEDSGLLATLLNISLTGLLHLIEIWLILLLLQNNEMYLIVLYNNKTLSKVPF